MKHAFFLAPAGISVGLTTVALGLFNALDRRGVRVAFFKPISQLTDDVSGLERSTHFIRATTTLQPADPIPVLAATKTISEGPAGTAGHQDQAQCACGFLDLLSMCLPEQVLVYGDCAVIPDPDVETLADIAIQSADSAQAFGIPPRVAMISYSTGESGSGAGVEKVRAATKLAQSKRPDLLIDGPLQYDAAFMPDVAKTKAPNSPVAGRATVFIFPDLNTGNTTYKAVQRSANVISVGPMLQGLRRPVNDLSRGALVDDIVYTIALTAIQATQV